MSQTTVLCLEIGKGSSTIKELRNSHGSAPVVWNEIAKKYLGIGDHEYMHSKHIERLWPLWKDLNIPEYQRAVLMLTFDKVYVVKANFKRAASDIRKFLEDFPPIEGRANHWDAIASVYESNTECEAIGLHLTSVIEDQFLGEWNEELEDYDAIDWSETSEAYANIDGISKDESK